jgi:hypothetical protein
MLSLAGFHGERSDHMAIILMVGEIPFVIGFVVPFRPTAG